MAVGGHSFPKRERIVRTRQIETLFGSGSKSMVAYPLRVVFRKIAREQQDVTAQLLISVPKKRFKHAVDRNLAKRQVREAFRQSKQLLSDAVGEGETLQLGFVWISDEHVPSSLVRNRMEKLFKRIAEKA